MQKAKATLKNKKIVITAAFLIAALGVGYFSQPNANIAQYQTGQSQLVNTGEDVLAKSRLVESSSGSGTPQFAYETSGEFALSEPVPAEQYLATPLEAPSIPNMDLTFDRLVIFTANMDMNVTSVRGAIQDLQGISYSLGGYVSDSYINPIPAGSWTEKGILAKQSFDTSVTLRIPSSNFNDALNRISSLGDVISMTTSSKDVTDQYVDLQARTKNLENVLEQYRNILKNATKTSDILDVQSRIDNIQEQIERLKAQLAQTEKQTSFALITIHLVEPLVVKSDGRPIDQPEKDTLERAFTDVVNMATSIAQAEARGLMTLTVGLLPVYPILAVGYVVYRKFVAKKNKEVQLQ
jgi:hypothetical protein